MHRQGCSCDKSQMHHDSSCVNPYPTTFLLNPSWVTPQCLLWLFSSSLVAEHTISHASEVAPEELVPSHGDKRSPSNSRLLPPNQQPEPLVRYYAISAAPRLVLSSFWLHLSQFTGLAKNTKDFVRSCSWQQFKNDEMFKQESIAFETHGESFYYPVAAQRALTTDSHLTALMQIEPEASKDEAFLERLKNARTILLICVYQGIAFSALRGIIDAGITDDDLPLTTSHIQGLKCYGVDEHKLRQFVKCQRHFKPARLDGNGSKLFRSEETIIPYTEWKDIGSGTFSSVYKVTLKAREHDIYGDQVEEVRTFEAFSCLAKS